MRITLATPRTGVAYFPGLAAPRTLDLAKLPEPLAREIEDCVKALAGERESKSVRAAAGHRDDVHHIVTIEMAGGESRTVEGPPVGAMGKLVTAFRSALRASSD